MSKHIAIYVRVSSKAQDTKSQEPDLKAWAESQQLPVVWYRDKATGKTMERPGWAKLEEDIRHGKVATVACWRLDRLGRTARGLTALFAELGERKVNLVSLKDGMDLSTSAGRLMAHVLASVAQYETEVRAERVHVGLATAKANGVKLGRPKGVHTAIKVDAAKVETVHKLDREGMGKSYIAKATGLSRPTVYRILSDVPTEASV